MMSVLVPYTAATVQIDTMHRLLIRRTKLSSEFLCNSFSSTPYRSGRDLCFINGLYPYVFEYIVFLVIGLDLPLLPFLSSPLLCADFTVDFCFDHGKETLDLASCMIEFSLMHHNSFPLHGRRSLRCLYLSLYLSLFAAR
jgi:hypothetical protein